MHVGSMLFTLVDPERGHEVAYNRWYERDHYYSGCMIGPYLLAGSRWVSTRALKDMRLSDGSGEVTNPIERGSYVSIYWVEAGHHHDHFDWARTQVVKLYKEGRGFTQRIHAHTILADQPRVVYRDKDPVPLTVALDHRFAGLVSVALDRNEGVTEDDLIAWLDTEALPNLLEGSTIACASSWKPEPRTGDVPMDLGTTPGTEARQLQVMFVDDRPETAWDDIVAYSEAIAGSGLATMRWASPFIPTIIGTDTYTDELW